MNGEIKVVHITTVHNLYDTRIFHKECKTLAKSGFRLTLIASVAKKANKEQLDEKLFDILPIHKFKNRFLRIILGPIHALFKAKKLNAKIYHIHDPELLIIARLLKNKNNKVIYDVHEDYETSIMQKKYIPKIFRKLVSKFYNYFERIVLRDLELCLAEKYYQHKYKNGKCILNYPLIENYSTIKKEESNNNKVNLLYTGNVTEDRGCFNHVDILNFIEDAELTLIGKCSSELANKLKEIIVERKDNLRIIGIDQFVNREKIDKMYTSLNWTAGLAIFPPTDHYMQKELTKFFEYMAAGIPIICSDFPVWKDFITRYNCGITVNHKNKKEIKDAVLYLYNNPDVGKVLGENGKKAVMNELNWEEEGIKLVSWYRELVRDLKREKRFEVEH